MSDHSKKLAQSVLYSYSKELSAKKKVEKSQTIRIEKKKNEKYISEFERVS